MTALIHGDSATMDVLYIRDMIIEVIDKYSTMHGINYRLPPPIASTTTRNKMWNKLIEIHPWHLHPLDILPSSRSVIVFAIPLSLEAINSNIKGEEPSIQWLKEYILTNKLIEEVDGHLSRELKSIGYKTIGIKPTHDYDPVNLRSSWSHRHAGYMAGLGTFGLNNLLITEKGCAVRLGTILTEAYIEETPKPTIEYCLAKRGVKCYKCIHRCPINALSDWSKGKYRCQERLNAIALKYKDIVKEFADACGKCATGIPCATKIG